jgi:hypothetical protein
MIVFSYAKLDLPLRKNNLALRLSGHCSSPHPKATKVWLIQYELFSLSRKDEGEQRE